ncbi:hypothetical protein NDU88_003620 [Pleurodeles waltl]|uniref:Uncharacterized protein n=1 Tax=Pleurodeles waltl TaxID=8319 RepID=A0AAV7RDE3_PLEWA|nr:hypothetical protein NDU88_003620 [Pleurodeles waltl]
MKAACADTAACDPERKEEETHPFWVLGSKGVWGATRGPENADQEEQRTGTLKMPECNDGRQKRPLVQNPEAKEGEDVAGELTMVQEAHCKDSCHSSGVHRRGLGKTKGVAGRRSGATLRRGAGRE